MKKKGILRNAPFPAVPSPLHSASLFLSSFASLEQYKNQETLALSFSHLTLYSAYQKAEGSQATHRLLTG